MKKMSEKLIPKCRCGGVAELAYRPNVGEYVICGDCCTRSGYYGTEDEAIQAWNEVMGDRKANVSLISNCWDEDYIKPNIQGMCGKCGQTVYDHAKYCSECGAKLDWSKHE